jgi:hypothetical protein
VNNVYQLRQRVLRERLKQTLAAANSASDDTCMRLILLCLALLDRHTVDGKGQCRYCRTRREWWRTRSRRCTVLPMAIFYLEQPRELLNGRLK